MRVLTVQSKKPFFIVRMMVYGLKIIGLAPFSIPMKISAQINSRHVSIAAFQSSKIGSAYNLLLIILLLGTAAFSLRMWFAKLIAEEPSLLFPEGILGLVESILVRFTACVIIIHWSLRQKFAACIMNRLLEVDVQLLGLEKHPLNKRALIFLIIHVIVNSNFWISFWYVKISYLNSSELVQAIYNSIPATIVHWFILENFTIVNLVATNLQMVNKCLEEYKEPRNHSSRLPPVHDNCQLIVNLQTNYDDQPHGSLELLHRVRTMLSEICSDIEDFFTLPIFFSIACCFVRLFRGLFSIIQCSNNNCTAVEIFFMIYIIIIGYAYPIISLAISVTRTGNEAQLTGQIVHKLLSVAIRREIKTELKEFSLQLLHENIDFTAYGLFSLNSSLLPAFLGATATYFVVLVQFQMPSC